MEALIDSISRYTASLEQRLSALESALSVQQTQWAVWSVFIAVCLVAAIFMFSMMRKLEDATK